MLYAIVLKKILDIYFMRCGPCGTGTLNQYKINFLRFSEFMLWHKYFKLLETLTKMAN